MNRREFLVSASAASLVCATQPSWAVSSHKLGAVQVDVVSDGHLRLPSSFVFDGLPEDALKGVMQKHGLTNEGLEPDCNLTLLRMGNRTVLFDVGAGPNFMDSAGKVSDALAEIDVDPSDVTDVVFTHAHPDHIWGVLDDFDDPLFSEATYHIAEAEFDYWMDPNTVNTIGEARQAFAAGAARNLSAIADSMTRFKPEREILPGIFARATHGHTPGHTSFEVRNGGESLMVVGDAIGNHHVAFDFPQWEANSDQDRALGAQSRVSLMQQVAAEKTKVIGFHFPYPGIGFVDRSGDGYQWVAA